jgi:hypothetical protein
MEISVMKQQKEETRDGAGWVPRKKTKTPNRVGQVNPAGA